MIGSILNTALIDGDILVYRIGFANQSIKDGVVHPKSDKYVRKAVDSFISDLLLFSLDIPDYEGWVSGPSEDNYRHAIAITAPYKGNRKGTRPFHYDLIRSYLQEHWGFVESVGNEADDCLAIAATERPEDSIIVTIDKDLDQVPGWHYNFVKGKKYYVTDDEGLRNFFISVLVGDKIDNIIGLRGIGPKRASEALVGCSRFEDYYAKCVELFGGSHERVRENCKLLYLQRSVGDVLKFPERQDDTTIRKE